MVTELGVRARRGGVGACALALALVACGGSAELTASSMNGGGSGSGVSGASSTPAQGVGGTYPTYPSGGSGQAGATSSIGGGSSRGGSGPVAVGGIGGGSATGGALGEAGSGGSTSMPRSCNPITFDDPALEAVVRKWLNKPTGQLTPQDAHQIAFLQASNAGITSLGGIECLPLNTALLDGNEISDLGPIAALKNLQQLVLTNNPVGELGPLAGLAELRALDLSGAGRVLTKDDFEVLGALPRLVGLTLNFDLVGELTPLAKAPALATLSLASGQVLATDTLDSLTQILTLELSNTGVTPDRIAQLKQLTYLGFELNGVRDISPLALLTNLELLDLSFNDIDDLTPLASMSQLQRVALTGNRVTDLTPLRALANLHTVNAQDNHITTLTPLVQNPGIDMGDLLWLGENPLDCQAEAANIAALQARQVGVQSDCTVPQP